MKALRIVGRASHGPEAAETDGADVVACTRARPDGERGRINQDALAVVPIGSDRLVLVVVDGMGGAPSGDVAARLTLDAVIDALAAAHASGSDITAAVLGGIDKANADVQALGVGAGATLAIADVHGARCRTYHVGDAGVFVVGQRGKKKLWTPSHSPVGYAIQAGVLDESDAMAHDDRHLVSNAIGSAGMHIEVGPALSLAARDTLLVGSDGVFDNLTLDELGGMIRTGSVMAAARGVLARLQERMAAGVAGDGGKPDDASFALLRRSGGG